jgi:hypothetical protein
MLIQDNALRLSASNALHILVDIHGEVPAFVRPSTSSSRSRPRVRIDSTPTARTLTAARYRVGAGAGAGRSSMSGRKVGNGVVLHRVRIKEPDSTGRKTKRETLKDREATIASVVASGNLHGLERAMRTYNKMSPLPIPKTKRDKVRVIRDAGIIRRSIENKKRRRKRKTVGFL